MIERVGIVCECGSLEHQVFFWYDEEEKELYCEPHLSTYRNFFKRLWVGLKYAFGYRSRFGEWDSTVFRQEDMTKLKEFLDKR